MILLLNYFVSVSATLHNVYGPHPMSWRSSEQRLCFPEKEILFKPSMQKLHLSFQVGALWNSDSRQQINSCLYFLLAADLSYKF